MKEFLQGRWLKHPLHPILVHVPTALWPTSLVTDILSLLGNGSDTMVTFSFYAILFGIVAALGAIVTGLADWSDVRKDKPAWKIGLYHMSLNLGITALWAINLGLRLGDLDGATRVGTFPIILSVIANLLLMVSGYLGGAMVYDNGIGIARLSKKKWRKVAEEGGARVPEGQEAGS